MGLVDEPTSLLLKLTVTDGCSSFIFVPAYVALTGTMCLALSLTDTHPLGTRGFKWLDFDQAVARSL